MSTGGALGAGGSLPTTGGSPGSGGALSSGGSNASGGRASGGAQAAGGAGGASSGGASSGGAASGGSESGTGGASNDVLVSPGCGKSGRPSGGMLSVSNSHFVAFPEGYDGSTPYPVLFGFHGCGGTNRGDGQSASSTEFIKLTNNTDFVDDTVRAVPISSDSGGCWNYNTDISRVRALYDDLVDNYCIDQNRVFATGHSSGAQFIVQILTKKADADHFSFAAVAPVAASNYGAHAVPMPAMYIQGKNDTERKSDGADEVARFRDANQCAASSMPYTQVMGCQSSGTAVNPGCISYDGCSVPTIWCSHNDPQYNGTSHGVPCFAMTAMHDFFLDGP